MKIESISNICPEKDFNDKLCIQRLLLIKDEVCKIKTENNRDIYLNAVLDEIHYIKAHNVHLQFTNIEFLLEEIAALTKFMKDHESLVTAKSESMLGESIKTLCEVIESLYK